jgi:hypothetical protein
MEWSPSGAIKAARGMEARHGKAVAVENARLYQRAYWPSAWGHRHWGFVVELLEGTKTEAEILAFEKLQPARGWPTNATMPLSPVIVGVDLASGPDVSVELHARRDAHGKLIVSEIQPGPAAMVDGDILAGGSIRRGVESAPPVVEKWPRWFEERGLKTEPLPESKKPQPAASKPEQGSLF